jgi:hypothetical protein
MLTELKGVFAPEELKCVQRSFDNAWAKVVGLNAVVGRAEIQTVRLRLGRIILRLHSGNASPPNNQITDAIGYFATTISHRPF